jgi:hypothetical protein
MSAQIITKNERVISAWFTDRRVDVYIDGMLVGVGQWTGTRLEGCDARLGSTPEETEELYAALDRELLADWTGAEPTKDR